jgi:hypothetical protein
MEENILENYLPEEDAAQEPSASPKRETAPPGPPASPAPAPLNPLVMGAALVVAFAAGLFLGLLGRPLVIQDVPVQVVVTVLPDSRNPAATQADPQEPAAVAEAGLAVPDPNATPTPTLMEFVMADARHIQGEETAPVTLVEFSDFK